MYFGPTEVSQMRSSFGLAEKLTEKYFSLGAGGIKSHPYEVKTLIELREHEVHEKAFAHLCKYYVPEKSSISGNAGFSFYKVCLQDNRILDAVTRGGSFIKFAPLMLYIALHEMVHVVRFGSGAVDFEAPEDQKREEEERVNVLTRGILKPVADRELNLVIDCFNDCYHIGDIFNN